MEKNRIKHFLEKSVRTGKQKDIAIELLRIYACMLVIFAHIQISYLVDGAVNKSALVIKCLIGDNVPIFLLILGFYMFTAVQGEDRMEKIPGTFVHKLKGFLIRIYIPTLIVTLIACVASDFIYRQKTLTQLFQAPSFHWEYLSNYVLLQDPTDMVGQFWYIVVYIKILLFFPLLALICVDQKAYNRIRRAYMALAFLSMVLADASYLTNLSLLTIKEYVFDEHFLYVLLGYEIALFFQKCQWKRALQIAFSAGIFLVGVALRYGLTYYAFGIFGVGNSDHFMVLECAPAYISSAGSLMLFYAVFHGLHNRLIQYVGGITFYVYMLHGMILRYFGSTGDQIRTRLNNGSNGAEAVFYYLEYGLVLFVTSLIAGVLLKTLYDLVCRGVGRLVKIREK